MSQRIANTLEDRPVGVVQSDRINTARKESSGRAERERGGERGDIEKLDLCVLLWSHPESKRKQNEAGKYLKK